MKAEFLLTIRLAPESRQELIDTYGAQYRHFRQEVEQALRSGAGLQLPPTARIRWLLESGRWE